MNLKGLQNRLAPLTRKFLGELPLCPWRTVLHALNPATLRARPPEANIEQVAEVDGLKKLRFDGKHEAWFPKNTKLTTDLWIEYLSVFWNHPINGHHYITDTPVCRGDVCIDGGASEGFFGLQALEAGAAKVICIEPSQAMARALERTFENQIRDNLIVVRPVALAAFNSTAGFQFDPERPFAGALGRSSADEVTTTTLDDLSLELNLDRVDFIKMDLEGAEFQAIEGGLSLLRRDHPRLAITTYHRDFDFAALRAILMSVGYRKITPTGITAIGSPYAPPFRPVMLHAWV